MLLSWLHLIWYYYLSVEFVIELWKQKFKINRIWVRLANFFIKSQETTFNVFDILKTSRFFVHLTQLTFYFFIHRVQPAKNDLKFVGLCRGIRPNVINDTNAIASCFDANRNVFDWLGWLISRGGLRHRFNGVTQVRILCREMEYIEEASSSFLPILKQTPNPLTSTKLLIGLLPFQYNQNIVEVKKVACLTKNEATDF